MEYTKGKWEIDGRDIYHSDANGRMTIICQMDNASAPPKEMGANAKELVRRWNAFEEDSSHDKLVEACRHFVDAQEMLCRRDVKLGKCEGGSSCGGGCIIYETLNKTKAALKAAGVE